MHDSTHRVPLEDGHADVDRTDDAVDLTVRLGTRAVLGLSFTPAEARNIGAALYGGGLNTPAGAYRHTDPELAWTLMDEATVTTTSEVNAAAHIVGRRDDMTGKITIELFGGASVFTPSEALELAAYLHAFGMNALAQEPGDRLHAAYSNPEAASAQILAAEDDAADAERERLFSQTIPNDEGPDYPSTRLEGFASVPGHTAPLDVLALITDDGPLFHVADACLDRATTAALVNHLTSLLDATA